MNEMTRKKLAKELSELLADATASPWEFDGGGGEPKSGHVAGVVTPDSLSSKGTRRIAYFGPSKSQRKTTEAVKRAQRTHKANAKLACLLKNNVALILEALNQ